MDYFDLFVSDCAMGSGTQSVFTRRMRTRYIPAAAITG